MYKGALKKNQKITTLALYQDDIWYLQTLHVLSRFFFCGWGFVTAKGLDVPSKLLVIQSPLSSLFQIADRQWKDTN